MVGLAAPHHHADPLLHQALHIVPAARGRRVDQLPRRHRHQVDRSVAAQHAVPRLPPTQRDRRGGRTGAGARPAPEPPRAKPFQALRRHPRVEHRRHRMISTRAEVRPRRRHRNQTRTILARIDEGGSARHLAAAFTSAVGGRIECVEFMRPPASRPRSLEAPARLGLCAVLLLAATGCHERAVAASRAEPDGDWPVVGKDYQNRRFSELEQIATGNVSRLKVAWTLSTGIPKGHEGAPLIVGDTMYLVTPCPNRAYAFDLRNPGGPPKWIYEPQPRAAAQGVACCDVVNRGPAFWQGKLFFNTLDDYTVAVDTATGKEAWRTRLGDINQGESMTMAPLVVKGKVLVGDSGGAFGVRGWLAALDADSGKLLWRAYSTGHDAACLIGADFHPYYEQD